MLRLVANWGRSIGCHQVLLSFPAPSWEGAKGRGPMGDLLLCVWYVMQEETEPVDGDDMGRLANSDAEGRFRGSYRSRFCSTMDRL